MMKSLMLAALVLLPCLMRTAEAADVHEDHGRIRAVATAHALEVGRANAPAGARVSAEANRIDPRLRLAACAVRPETFTPPGQRSGAHVNVGVRCPTAPAWSLYVPVRLEVAADVLVLAAPAGRGDVLGRDQLRVETRDVARLSGDWLTQMEDAEGMMLRRLVQPGAVLTHSMLDRPDLIRRGDRVRLQSGRGGFAVQSEGEALSNAAAGDRVRVRNLHSRLVVEGVVEPGGAVRTGQR